MDALRKTPNADFDPRNEVLESDRVEIFFDGPESIEPLIEDYPFPEAQKIGGTLVYHPEQVILGMPTESEHYDISYRTGSKLLVIGGLDRAEKLKEVITNTSRNLETLSLRRIPYKRLSLWSFIFAGEYQPEIVVRDYENNELVDFEEFEHLSQEQLAQEYRLDRARVIFEYNDERIHVTYRDDELVFSGDPSDDAREYVLQLYEAYVVNGAINPRFE